MHVFAREAETTQPWTPADMVCELACHQVARSVYDTLTMVYGDGEPQPYLLESMEPNADFTEWTLVAREGVTFHDGTPFDASSACPCQNAGWMPGIPSHRDPGTAACDACDGCDGANG